MEITKVVLQTNQLDKMKAFYSTIFNLPFLINSVDRFEIQFGKTSVLFTDANITGEPFYHFAFDIPPNLFKEAKKWIKNKIPLLTEEKEDEVYFSTIRANSFYFEDPSGNIIELIARLDNPSTSDTSFSAKNIEKMSEISLVVSDKIQVSKLLENYLIFNRDGEKITEANSLSFMTMGNSPVYLLLVQPNRRWFFSNKFSTIYPIDILLNNELMLGVNNQNMFYINKKEDN